MRKGQLEPDCWGDESGKRVIVCVGEHNERVADWSSMEQIMATHAVPCARGITGNRPILYGFLQADKVAAFRKATFRAGLTHLWDAAYPSSDLAAIVNGALQDGVCQFSPLYRQFLLVEPYKYPGVFLVSDRDPRQDDAMVFYVGYATKSVSAYLWLMPGQITYRAKSKKQVPMPLTEYVRAHTDVSHAWVVTIFPQEICLRIALAGHIIPGFERNQETTERCLVERYQDNELMLAHAQEALIALLRPPLNLRSIYPRALPGGEVAEKVMIEGKAKPSTILRQIEKRKSNTK